MGDLMIQYGNFYTWCTRHFQQVHFQHAMDHEQETNKEIKVLQEMNTKHGLSPNLGVDKLKKEQKQALRDHVDDLMTHFWAKSHRWTTDNDQEQVDAPTESNIDLRPNVPVCEAEEYGATEDYFQVVIIGLNTFKK